MQLIIYISGKPLIICDRLNERFKARIGEEKLLHLIDPPPEKIPPLIGVFEDDSMQGAVIETSEFERVRAVVFSGFNRWEAAGGLVTNQEGEILLLFRRGKWDLPKGKLDPGETMEACALREVTEETGLQHIHIEGKLTDTFHTYRLGDSKNILKQTHWYKMKFTGSELTVPQIEEDILDIQWVKKIHLDKYLKYTYPNIRDVFAAAGSTLS